jgi:phosphate transport system substrate-binding protein
MLMSRFGLVLVMAIGNASALSIQGAGATFPAPLYTRYFSEYNKLTGNNVTYDSVGSGAGQKQILAQTVDFGASDSPMSNENMAKAPNGNTLLHIPMALGAVVPVYNLPELEGQFQFTGDLLAKMFLGKVKKWNDPEIVALNPSLKEINLTINVIHREAGSGTTFIFTDYLSKVSKEWKQQIGVTNTPNWPVGITATGNKGIIEKVAATPASLSYTEYTFLRSLGSDLKADFGAVRNQSNNMVFASPTSILAASSASYIGTDTRVSITNAAGANSYPIVSYTYLLVYKDQAYGKRTQEEAKALVKLLEWMVGDAQKYNTDLGYGRLSDIADNRAKALIKSITFAGRSLK